MELSEENEVLKKLNYIKKENFKAYTHVKNIINIMYNEIKNEKK